MTGLGRRAVLTGAAALATTATALPVANKAAGIVAEPLDPEAQELVRAWMLLSDGNRALMHQMTRRLARLPYRADLAARYDREGQT